MAFARFTNNGEKVFSYHLPQITSSFLFIAAKMIYPIRQHNPHASKVYRILAARKRKEIVTIEVRHV
ncbi:MAG: hypothetical protein HW390_603 [Candidatus Brocadiaceae bacterium]|nr:hypothetical protein [Candidatus Brocadiaceae bacterium]